MKKLLKITIIVLLFFSLLDITTNAATLPTEEQRAFYNEHIILIKTVLFFTNIMLLLSFIFVITIPIILIIKRKLSYKQQGIISRAGIWSFLWGGFFSGCAVHLTDRPNYYTIATIIVIMIIYIIHIGTTISKLIKTKEKDTIKAKKSKNN